MIFPTSLGESSRIITGEVSQMSNLRTLPCDGHEARARAHIAPSSELRLHAMIALCLYHGSSEVALETAMADSLERCDDGLCRV